MKILFLYIIYLWVLMIHAFFIGISAFAIWPQKLRAMKPLIAIFLLLLPLLFFELYWIPVFKYFGLEVFFSDETILEHFQMNEKDNLIEHVRFVWYHPILLLLAAFLSYRIGLWVSLKK